MLRRAFQQVLELVYPPQCVVCGETVDAGEKFCVSCGEQLAVLEDRPACGRCAAPLATDDAPCVRCMGAGIRPFGRVAALGVYDGPLRRLIHHFKYAGGWANAELLAGRLARHAPARDVLARADALVPVPLHPRRQRWRGYDQADVIARVLAARFRLPIVRPAVRTKHTPTQTHQTSRRGRVLNVDGAFLLVRPQAIAGRNLVLVDDVMTSGATVRSLARVLQSARPTGMDVIVVAVADAKGHGFEKV